MCFKTIFSKKNLIFFFQFHLFLRFFISFVPFSYDLFNFAFILAPPPPLKTPIPQFPNVSPIVIFYLKSGKNQIFNAEHQERIPDS